MKPEVYAVTLKLKTGEDIIGYYLGEVEESDINRKSISLYRPIKIRQLQIKSVANSAPSFVYVSDLYSLYGGKQVNIPYSEIVTRDVADPFFVVYYERSLGGLVALEDSIQETYIKAYQKQDLQEIMKNSDSVYMDINSEFLQ